MLERIKTKTTQLLNTINRSQTLKLIIVAVIVCGVMALARHAQAQVESGDYGPTLSSSVTPDTITGAISNIIYPGILAVMGVGAAVFGSFWIYYRVRSAL